MKKTLTIFVAVQIVLVAAFGLGFWLGDVYGKTKREAELKAQIQINKENIEYNFDLLKSHTTILEDMAYKFETLEVDCIQIPSVIAGLDLVATTILDTLED